MSLIVRRFHCPSPPRRWRWSALFLLWMLPLWMLPFAVPAQISDAKIEALVEALRLSAPPVTADSGLFSDWGVKPDNIARWSRRCLDRDVAPEQFAADQALARRVLVCVMGPVLREQFAAGRNEIVAVQRAAAWWMTGDPDQYRDGATDAYTLRVLEAYLRFF